VRHWNRAVLHPDLVSVGMVTMVMRVEREPDWFVSDRPDFRDDLLRARRKIAIDHQDIILKHYPAVVAMALALDIPLVKVNIGRKLLNLVYLRLDRSVEYKEQKDHSHPGIFGKSAPLVK
jgi:hypothetical protein